MDKLPVHIAVFLIALVYATTLVASQRTHATRRSWSVFDYPNPQFDYHQCGRPNASSVCDPAGIISRESADSIDSLINALYRETRCLCYDCTKNLHGHIIKVAILPSMERVFSDRENTTSAALRDAQMYSYILTLRWRMDGACNETLLILYSKNDQILYTLTRKVTKMKLSDSDVKKVTLAVRPYFDKEETIGAGLIEMIHRYRLLFEDKRSEAFRSAPSG